MPNVDYDYDQLFPGRFLKSGEFKGKDCTLTISDVRLEELENKRKGKHMAPVLSFKETKKQLVLNKTNGECVKGLFGRKVSEWVGKRVCFYPVDVNAFGTTKLAIRVRGSPDIAADKQIVCQIGTDSVTVTMKKTGSKPNQNAGRLAAPGSTLDTRATSAAIKAAGGITDSEIDRAGEPPVDEPPADLILPGQTHPGMNAETGEVPFGDGH